MSGPNHRLPLWICLVLAAGTLMAFWPLGSNGFVNVDDPQYILLNPKVTAGLTWDGIQWAFQSGYAANWHPLTWISHMLDCTLFGLHPGGHHLVNVLLHLGNTLLLFACLMRMTGALWRSAFVAAFFAWHPLHVESVAWAAERKDVLSTLFWFLTMLAYHRYVQQSQNGLSTGWKQRLGSKFYGLSLLLFALGLMCKPMLVTLPFALLLLDFWPLNRWHLPARGQPLQLAVTSLRGLVLEKIPFFALSVVVSVVTFLVQQKGGAVSSFGNVPLSLRCANAVVSYVRYLAKTFWPADLAPIYPLPDHVPLYSLLLAVLLVGAISAACVLRARQQPYLFTGWFWYLGTLVPTLGIIQVGSQAMADRYFYIPGVGVFLLVIWGLAELKEALKLKLVVPVGATLLVACMAVTWWYSHYWRDSVKLYARAVEVTPNNYVGYDFLGKALHDAKRDVEAELVLKEAVRLKPRYAEARYNLGTVYLERGMLTQAITNLAVAVKLSPDNIDARHNLGMALLRAGFAKAALEEFSQVVSLDPKRAQSQFVLGSILLQVSKPDQAVVHLNEALRLDPKHVDAAKNLGVALVRQGRVKEAVAAFEQAVRLAPEDPMLRFNLGLAQMELQRPQEAVATFQEALRLQPGDSKTHYRLGSAYATLSKTNEAILQYREALRLNPDLIEAKQELASLEATDPKRD